MVMMTGNQIYHSYFEEYDLVFTLIPKNANTSIKCSLIKTFIDKDYIVDNVKRIDSFHGSTISLFNFIDNDELYHLNNDSVKRCLRISVVRNPFSRLFSGWNDKIRKLTVSNGRRRRFGFVQACNFEQFIKHICLTPDKQLDGHFIPQHNFITYPNGELITDKILKFETLFSDWKDVQDLILLRNNMNLHDLPKKKLNSTSSLDNKSYRKHYSNQTRKLVETKFKKDLTMFNYEF